MTAADDHVPSVLKMSTFAVGPWASEPPITMRRPSCNRTEHPTSCADAIVPPEDHVPVVTCGREAFTGRLRLNRPNARAKYRMICRMWQHSAQSGFGGAIQGRYAGPLVFLNSRFDGRGKNYRLRTTRIGPAHIEIARP